MDFATELMRNLTDANMAAREHTRIGRAMMARDVNSVIGTLSARKGPMEVINELIALCKKEPL